MLHIVKHSPFDNSSLSQCIARMQPEDALLLIQDGVYALQSLSQWQGNLAADNRLYVLEDDAITRGISTQDVAINWVDYDKFVELTLRYSNTLSW